MGFIGFRFYRVVIGFYRAILGFIGLIGFIGFGVNESRKVKPKAPRGKLYKPTNLNPCVSKIFGP